MTCKEICAKAGCRISIFNILVVSFVVIVKFCQHKVSLYSIFCQFCIDWAQTFLKCLHVVNLIALGWWLLTSPKSLTVVAAAVVAISSSYISIHQIHHPSSLYPHPSHLSKQNAQSNMRKISRAGNVH